MFRFFRFQICLLLLVTVLTTSLAAQTLEPLGGEISISLDKEAQLGRTMALAMAPDGSFISVWQESVKASVGDPGFSSSTIRGRLFGPDGTPLGPDFPVSQQAPLGIEDPAVVRQPNGQFVVVWEDLSNGLTPNSLLGQVVTSTGTLGASQFFVGSALSGGKTPAIAASRATGDFVVVWQDEDESSQSSILASLFSANATAKGEEFKLESGLGESPSMTQPTVAMAPNGDFVVGWNQLSGCAATSSGQCLVMRWFTASGQPAGEPVVVDSGARGASSLVLNSDGSVVIAWVDFDQVVRARRFTGTQLLPASSAVEIAAPEELRDLRLDRVGHSLVAVWSEPEAPLALARNIVGRQLSSRLQPIGQPFTMNSVTENTQQFPALSANAAGHLVAGWWDQGTGANGVKLRGQLFKIESTCTADTHRLCLNGGRFAVEAQWSTIQATAGAGIAVPLTDDTGYFTFFSAENVEVVVKVLDGCFPPFNHYWVFASGLTNVEVELTVTDTQTGEVVTYFNPQLTPFQPIQDTQAFDTCP